MWIWPHDGRCPVRISGHYTPGPKLRTRCSERSCPGLYQAFKLGRRRSLVPSCTRSSRGVAARPVNNLVSIGGSGPVRSRPVADASGAPVLRDQGPIGRPGTARPIITGDNLHAILPCGRIAADTAVDLPLWMSPGCY
jgi:hypothetical protein